MFCLSIPRRRQKKAWGMRYRKGHPSLQQRRKRWGSHYWDSNPIRDRDAFQVLSGAHRNSILKLLGADRAAGCTWYPPKGFTLLYFCSETSLRWSSQYLLVGTGHQATMFRTTALDKTISAQEKDKATSDMGMSEVTPGEVCICLE